MGLQGTLDTLPVLDAHDAVRIVDQLWAAGKYPKLIGGDALFLKAFAVPGAHVTTYAPDASREPQAAELVRLYQTIFGDFEREMDNLRFSLDDRLNGSCDTSSRINNV
mgnify:CR=1 FL=1